MTTFGWLMVCFCVALPDSSSGEDENVEFYRDRVKPLLKTRCFACHGAIKQEADLRLDTGALIRSGGESGPAIDLKEPDQSLLLQRISASDPGQRMPPGGEALTPEQIAIFSQWIRSGGDSPENDRPQIDPRQHWAFQPIGKIKRPGAENEHPVDAFIQAQLSANGLSRAQPAEARTLIRRFYLDLHGLPPAAEEITQFELAFNRNPTLAVNACVDHLLASPRYGERWAQHWLDLVRYADTHGFEVNTPRPNAWPYRDYVIRAFNEDKPYDRFVFEQMAGDSVGEDAATGFLVAAAVLLPGQIGKDDASKRLARQDELDEMIVGTSATFLGLTVGCARCHDHKFDPISQRDYYAMQAFFAGVDYGDRKIRDNLQQQRESESARLEPRIAELTEQLRQYEPIAFTGTTIILDDEDESRGTSLAQKNGNGINPPGAGRGYRDDPGDASHVANLSRGRYTWWTNNPGEDVFTWNPESSGRFRFWISWGVDGSDDHTRDARYVLDRDGDLQTSNDQTEIARIDQRFFSGVAEGESEQAPLWSGLFDAGIHEITETTRLILRGGETGTGITADTIVLQEAWQGSDGPTGFLQLREPVQANRNLERFSPVDAKFVRFTTHATNNDNQYEPCLDELQIFTVDGSRENIALAANGTKATSSGNLAEAGIHQLKHINDGKHGNNYSWISNEKGHGWVQLEFSQIARIGRIEWARDREGKFKDRLPVDYEIETSLDGVNWKTVASSADRAPQGTPAVAFQSLTRNARSNPDLQGLVVELRDLQKRKSQLDQPRLVYGGVMREPDVIHVLLRGDPEQPVEEVAPRTPAIFGGEALSEDDERKRRVELANWIASPDHPLTARVIVNRVWQYHFGSGLVDTASDFGLNGTPPTHPELLDWLAGELIESGWSLKKLHRLILSSASYQQSAAMNSRAHGVDADCRLLWRFPSRRLEAEAIRDSILFVSGQLNLEMGGPGFDFFKSRGGLSGFPPVESFDHDALRRMIYAHKVRMETVPLFGAFDCPDAGQPMPKRSQSTTAIQALNLFNSPFIAEQSLRFAERVKSQSGNSIESQIELVFMNALGRKPTDVEAVATLQVAREHGLDVVCRVIFNSNEFLFLP